MDVRPIACEPKRGAQQGVGMRRCMLAGIVASLALLGACDWPSDDPEGGLTGPTTPTDTDGDGITGAGDRCPTQPETFNGVFDRDGCPDRTADLYVAAFNDSQAFWSSYFSTVIFRPYFPARLQLFSGRVSSSCGPGVGPSYCGLDATVYLDEPFLEGQLRRFGDFAPAMIVAHEVGHHTQNLLGLLNVPSIQKELQADCLAGAWSASAGARGLLEPGDFQEAAASLFSVGDPLGTPWFAPGAHGSPQQRQQAFLVGFSRGAFGCG